MATNDVPGANPRNADKLDIGCWAEADGGDSLMLVVGREDKQVIYQVYDLPAGLFYPDSMMEKEFKAQFSGKEWVWHDKTPFPWDKVMKGVGRPSPQAVDVIDEVRSAARKVASMLNLRGQRLTAADVASQGGAAGDIIERLADALREGFGVDRR